MQERIELLRAVTRALAFLLPMVSLCVGMFMLSDVRDTITGAIIGAVLTASVFYFKKSEDGS